MPTLFANSLKTTMLMAALVIAGGASAANDSPVGTWKTIDDATGKPKSVIRITDNGGVLEGKIEKLFRAPEENQNPTCDKCTGADKDQPIIGLTILKGLKKDGKEWNGGEITDPATGKVYKSKAELTDGGGKLQVRGYVGVPMFGRSQTWVREE